MAVGARFASGVYGYVRGVATIVVNFPVDKNGKADISCKQCPYYRYQSRRCALTESVIPFPETNVAPDCPLEEAPDDIPDEMEG